MADRSPILILTRPEGAAGKFAEQVHRELGQPVDTILSPLIRIEPCEMSMPRGRIGGLILTSANAVPALRGAGLAKGMVAWCVGSRTARAAREAGLDAQDAGGDAEALIALILERQPYGPLIHVKGEFSRGDVADRLSKAGIPCDERVVYRQIAQPPVEEARKALMGKRPVVLPLFSPRTAAILCRNGPYRAPLHAIAMSAAVAAELDTANMAGLTTVGRPDGPSMLTETVGTLRRLSPRAA